MTEKRYRKVLGLIEKNNGDLLDLTEIENELNQLVYENEQLKQQLFKVQKWLKILHDEHCPSLATIDGVLTEIDKAVNGDKR